MDEIKIMDVLRQNAKEKMPEFDARLWLAIPKTFAGRTIYYVMPDNRCIECGKYSYIIDPEYKISYNGDLSIKYQYFKQKYGRKLVEIRENTCRDLGIEEIIINNNTNTSFWIHMGYEAFEWSKRFHALQEEIPISISRNCEPPRYKKLK